MPAIHEKSLTPISDSQSKGLRGVGVGSMFGYLHALLDGSRLSENRRQRNTDERSALAALPARATPSLARSKKLVSPGAIPCLAD